MDSDGIALGQVGHGQVTFGPFVKRKEPVASPTGLCGGTGRCDDVIMQSRPHGEVHLYHSVKGTATEGKGLAAIHHTMTKDGGKTWSESQRVIVNADPWLCEVLAE